jgi:hypothetical protein
MRNLDTINHLRSDSRDLYGSNGDSGNGVFMITSKIDHTTLVVVASDQLGWDHVSVSHRKRVPNWYEMEQVKAMFFEEDETCMQLHVPASDHINNHANVLHLWRPQKAEIPRPPSIMVGLEGVTNVTSEQVKKFIKPSLVMASILAATMAQ